MTDEGIALEYEMYLASEGKTLKACFQCGFETHRDQCPDCSVELSGDKEVDDIFARIEAGEEINLDEALRGEQWEQVVIGGGE